MRGSKAKANRSDRDVDGLVGRRARSRVRVNGRRARSLGGRFPCRSRWLRSTDRRGRCCSGRWREMLDCCRTRRRGVVGYSERSRERRAMPMLLFGADLREVSRRTGSRRRSSAVTERAGRGREREREKYPARPKDLLCTVGVLRVCM